MVKMIAGPNRYIQGQGELEKLGKYVLMIGKRVLILVDKSIKDIVLPYIQIGMNDMIYDMVEFSGECCMKEIERVHALMEEKQNDAIIGIGGGKTLDTAKAVGYFAHRPVVIVPTSASSDAPCSAISVLYSDTGIFERYLYLPNNPNIVLVDTDIISKAPVRLLVAGMGDALATYFEARACYQSGAKNCIGGRVTKAAMALAKLCYETLLNDGYEAILALKNKTCTKAVENIIEANIYLSGIGFESGGLAAAHAIQNGLVAIKSTQTLLHGEKVAFGTIVQLVLEKAQYEEITEFIQFCKKIGLPTTLKDLNIIHYNSEDIMGVAKLACTSSDTISNMPFEVTIEDVYKAIMLADAYGKEVEI